MKYSINKIISLIITIVMALSLVGCNKNDNSSSEEKPSAKVTIEGTKFMVNGNELWINGVNTPWQNWNDFYGYMDEEFWDKAFEQLAKDNINCTRIWINCNGESAIKLKPNGQIKGIAEGHWSDLDKLFALANKHGIYIMATLLSFDHFKEPKNSAEKWRAMITSKEYTDEFATKYVAEFAQQCRYS